MSTDMFLGGNTAEAEGSVSQPNLISMQLRARAGSNFLGAVNSDGLKSNVLVLSVPINSLTPITIEVDALSSGRNTKVAVAFCVQ